MKSIYGVLIAGMALLMMGCATQAQSQSQADYQACTAQAKSPSHQWAREKLGFRSISPVALRDSSYPTEDEIERLEPFAALMSTCINYLIDVKQEQRAADLYITKKSARGVREVYAQLLAGEISYGEYYAGMHAVEAGEDAALAMAAEKRAQLAAQRAAQQAPRQVYQPTWEPLPNSNIDTFQKRDRGQRCWTDCSGSSCYTRCSPR